MALSCLLVSGCSNEFSGDNYTSKNAGEVSKTNEGTIISMRKVSLKSDGGPGAGALVGGVGGGLLGSAFGKGGGKALGVAAGALLGGVAGNAIENRSQDGIEYMVKLDSGATVALAQGPTPALSVGQRVFVIHSEKGKSRVVPA